MKPLHLSVWHCLWGSVNGSLQIGVGVGASRPSLRTLQAVFPHTALRSMVLVEGEEHGSSSKISDSSAGIQSDRTSPNPQTSSSSTGGSGEPIPGRLFGGVDSVSNAASLAANYPDAGRSTRCCRPEGNETSLAAP